MILYYICLIYLLKFVDSYETLDTNRFTKVIPLNFHDAILRINEKIRYTKTAAYNDSFVSDLFYEYHKNFMRLYDHVNNTFDLDETVFNLSKPCSDKLKIFIKDLKQRKEWTLRVVDAFGKIPSGIMEGAFIWPGEYTECLNVSIQHIDWRGKHCTLMQPQSFTMGFQLMFSYGICVPDKCTNEDITEIINSVLGFIPAHNNASYKINSTNVDCHEKKPLDPPSIFAIVVISIIVFIVIIATIYDVLKEFIDYLKKQNLLDTTISVIETEIEHETSNLINEDRERLLDHVISTPTDTVEHKILRILRSFSAYTNLKKLFNISQNENQLSCLHAIRFLSLSWVILGHSYVFVLSFTDNLALFGDWLKRFSFLVIINGVFSVDTFFLLSGLLTSYIFFKEVNKADTKLSFTFMFKYYLHRFWRLTPPFAIIMMFSALLSRYLGNGPFYPNDGFEMNYCKDTWWKSLLYINNFIDIHDSCFPVAWYLANDMQFHWIAPIILIPLYFNQKIFGMILSGLLLVGSILSIGLILNAYPGSENAMMNGEIDIYMRYIYTKPWARIGPFLIGLLIGYAIYAKKTNQININLTRTTNVFGWLFSLIVNFGVMFSLYPDFQGNPLSRTSHIVYQCLSRSLWGISVGFMIFSCITKFGGVINKILTWPFWVPLSRLSYSAYLIHPIVLLYMSTTLEHTFHVSDQLMIYWFLANLIVSYASAILVSIFFEIPLIGLEKFIFPKEKAST